MADNVLNFNDSNEVFFIKTAESRFNDYSNAIIKEDIDIIPRVLETEESRKDIHKYIKNLFD